MANSDRATAIINCSDFLLQRIIPLLPIQRSTLSMEQISAPLEQEVEERFSLAQRRPTDKVISKKIAVKSASILSTCAIFGQSEMV